MDEPPNDPFAQARRPFRITAMGIDALVFIAWADGWLRTFWAAGR